MVAQDYSIVDAKVKKYPKQFRSIEYFAKRIAKDFTTDEDRLRATYFWMANNIKYNYHQAEDISRKKIQKESFAGHLYNTDKYKFAENALLGKTAVCSGYSLLFKFVLEELDITCEYITGAAKTFSREIGVKNSMENHAWNAVKLNNQWHLIDVTWSTGNTVNTPNVFDFNDVYYLIPPEQLIENHFPKDEKWQLLKQPVSKSKFIFKPLIYGAYFTSGLELDSNISGIIKTKPKKPIILIFKTIDTSKKYYYSFENDKHSQPLAFYKKDNKYYTKINYRFNKKGYLLISSNSKVLMEFKVIPSVNTSY